MKIGQCIVAAVITVALCSAWAEAGAAQQDFAQGFELIKAGKLQAAAGKFEAGLKADPDNAQAHFYLAEAYLGLRQNDKAKAHYKKSLELDPNGELSQEARNRLEQLASGGGQHLTPGSEFQDCPSCPVMVVVPAGRFIMGSPPTETGRENDEGPPHLVKIGRAFAVGKFEVTFDEWVACVADNACSRADAEGWGWGRRPVINISYDQAVGYTEWLSEKTGKTYRLLSEAEWEYAARAGSDKSRYWGSSPDRACQFGNVYDRVGKNAYGFYYKSSADYDSQKGLYYVKIRKYDKDGKLVGGPWDPWTGMDYLKEPGRTMATENFDCDDGFSSTAPVGSFKPNAFGLYDMIGNVWEWVVDCYNKSYEGAPTDGGAWSTGDCSQRVIRGGGWSSVPAYVRSARRDRFEPSGRSYYLGLRVARTLP